MRRYVGYKSISWTGCGQCLNQAWATKTKALKNVKLPRG